MYVKVEKQGYSFRGIFVAVGDSLQITPEYAEKLKPFVESGCISLHEKDPNKPEAPAKPKKPSKRKKKSGS